MKRKGSSLAACQDFVKSSSWFNAVCGDDASTMTTKQSGYLLLGGKSEEWRSFEAPPGLDGNSGTRLVGSTPLKTAFELVWISTPQLLDEATTRQVNPVPPNRAPCTEDPNPLACLVVSVFGSMTATSSLVEVPPREFPIDDERVPTTI